VSNGGNFNSFIQEDFITIHRGMFVYEGIENCQDMSGTWMKDFLEEHFYVVTYTNQVPRSLSGYEAVFLSLGTAMTFSTPLEDGFVRIIKDYLQEGGKVYHEGGFTFALYQYNPDVWELFGIQDVTNPFTTFTTFPFDTLVGAAGSICEGLSFDQTNQVGQFFIDQYTPNTEGIVAFEEPGYGNVAVQHQGELGEKTFCFSWALAELQDGVTTREDLMWAILGYFNLVTGMESKAAASKPEMIVYPNPLKSSSDIGFKLDHPEFVNISIYNQLGLQVEVLMDQWLPEGKHQCRWNAGTLPPGLYFCRLQAGDRITTMKLVKVQ
jgi:hypothetical protein